MAYPCIGLTDDGGETWFLPRLVGLRVTQDMAYLERRLSTKKDYAVVRLPQSFRLRRCLRRRGVAPPFWHKDQPSPLARSRRSLPEEINAILSGTSTRRPIAFGPPKTRRKVSLRC